MNSGVPNKIGWYVSVGVAIAMPLVIMLMKRNTSEQQRRKTADQILLAERLSRLDAADKKVKSEVLKDGKRIEWTEVNGKREGVERVFFPDGQLHREVEYKNGKRNGHGRAFWEDGSLQFVAEYANDVEISGEAWDKGERMPEPAQALEAK